MLADSHVSVTAPNSSGKEKNGITDLDMFHRMNDM